jgi:hypothetical protein
MAHDPDFVDRRQEVMRGPQRGSGRHSTASLADNIREREQK